MESTKTIWNANLKRDLIDPDLTEKEELEMRQEENNKRYARLAKRASLVFTPEGVLGLMVNPKFPNRMGFLYRDTLEQCLIPKGRWLVADGELHHVSSNGWATIYRKLDIPLDQMGTWISWLSGSEDDSVDEEMKETAIRKISENTSSLGGEIMARERALACARRGV